MSAVTVQEVIDCLDYGDRMMCNQMVGRIRTHGIAPPDGFAIVPIEPTEAMIEAGGKWTHDNSDVPAKKFYSGVYKAMLTAAKDKP